MLKQLRDKKTAKKIWIFLAVIILPAFVLWGFQGALRDQTQEADLGKIFGRKISSLEYKDSLSAVKTQALMQFGEKYEEMEKYLNLETQAWQRLILIEEKSKNERVVKPKKVPKPASTDKTLPAITGSFKSLNIGIMDHINRGCLPSCSGKNLKVGSDFIIWAQRMYIASSTKTGRPFRLIKRITKNMTIVTRKK